MVKRVGNLIPHFSRQSSVAHRRSVLIVVQKSIIRFMLVEIASVNDVDPMVDIVDADFGRTQANDVPKLLMELQASLILLFSKSDPQDP